MSDQTEQRRSSVGSSTLPTQPKRSQQQGQFSTFPHSKSTPNMAEFDAGPTLTFARGASMWNNQSWSYNATPRITPSPITESPDEDVFSDLPKTLVTNTTAARKDGDREQANEFPSSDVIDQINAKMPQLTLGDESLSPGSSLPPSHQSTTPLTTPIKTTHQGGSTSSISPRTSLAFSGEEHQSVTPTPLDRGQAEKRRLVDLIKSGALTPDDHHSTQTAVVPRQSDQAATNAVQFTPAFVDLGYHVSTSESAQFFAYLQSAGGQLPLSNAFSLIPFAEKARMVKPKEWGVVKITNVCYFMPEFS